MSLSLDTTSVSFSGYMGTQSINAALAFMERATLQATDVESYLAVRQHLNELLRHDPEPRVQEVPPVDDMKLK